MKKLIVILAVFICVGLSAQEKTTLKNRIHIGMDIWDIPNGADTTQDKEIFDYFDVNDSITSGLRELYGLGVMIELNDTTKSYFDKKGKYQWVLYDNGAYQLMQPREIHVRVLKLPTPSEVKKNKTKKTFEELFGKELIEKQKVRDSLYYGKRTKIKLDTIN